MSADVPRERLKRKDYEKELGKLQVELCHLQDWVKANNLKVIVLFEGRDAAGKGGAIKALTEKVSRGSSASAPCQHRLTAKSLNYSFNVTSSSSRQAARS